MVKYYLCFCYIAVQNINKHLTPNFQGYANLCKAHDVMLKVAADINETQRLYEVSVRMQVCVYLHNLCNVSHVILLIVCTYV